MTKLVIDGAQICKKIAQSAAKPPLCRRVLTKFAVLFVVLAGVAWPVSPVSAQLGKCSVDISELSQLLKANLDLTNVGIIFAMNARAKIETADPSKKGQIGNVSDLIASQPGGAKLLADYINAHEVKMSAMSDAVRNVNNKCLPQ